VTDAGYARLFDLTGRVAIVTGGAGALGREIGRGLAAFGARVILADLDGERAAEAADGIAGARAETVDVTEPESAAGLVSRVVAADARIDVLVNAAGVFRVAPMLELKLSDWDTVLRVNLTGMFVMTQAVGAVMLRQGRGRVINLGSVSSRVGNPEYAAYAASKGGVAQLTRALGAEWCRHGVLVNAIGPAFTETALTRGYLQRPDARQRVIDKIPMGRMGEPRDIVGAAVFLASDASAFVVGQTLYVDGGRTL
jgi:NAD(P)-dependent dehydrogenase (short-subunit alcohol dehydrogenase family)